MTGSPTPAGSPPATAADVHPGRINVGQHLPYTGREVEIFSRYGYFYPPGYLPNTPYNGFRGFATTLTRTQFGMKPNVRQKTGAPALQQLSFLSLSMRMCVGRLIVRSVSEWHASTGPALRSNTRVYTGIEKCLFVCSPIVLLQYFVSFGIGAAKLAGCFLLFYFPLDNVYCDLRKKVKPNNTL